MDEDESDKEKENGLRPDDPYQDMLAKQKADRMPSFWRGGDKSARKGAAQSGLGAAEGEAAKDGAGGGGGLSGAKERAKRAEEMAGRAGKTGFNYTGSGRGVSEKAESKMKGGMKLTGAKASVGIFLIFGLLIGVVAIFVFASPLYMIGSIDYNLQDSLGFSETSAILEEQGEYVTDEMLAAGEVPSEYAERLAEQGIFVGQVTAAGDFVRTNTYIANIEELDDIAAIGSGFQVHGSEGALAVLFKDVVTVAGEFADVVERNPEMYAAYSAAADIPARYYYSDEVDAVYKDLGISRSNFGNWERTGNSETDQESFNNILQEGLKNNTDMTADGCHDDSTNPDTGESVAKNCDTAKVSKQGSAEEVINATASIFKGGNATAQAAAALNAALAASDNVQSMKAFVLTEEPLQMARAGDNGPVNEAMTTLAYKTPATYTDVNTGEEVTVEKSILETANFVAAVSNEKFSKDEANNFSNDRVLIATRDAISRINAMAANEGINLSTLTRDTVKETSMAMDGRTKAGAVLKTSAFGSTADVDALGKASSSVDMVLAKDALGQYRSVIGGNSIVKGGADLNNTINTKVIAAMASDSATVLNYHNEAREVLARRADADRATLSPFDTSSPNTFLGSIVHGFATAMISNGALTGGRSSIISAVSAVADMTNGASGGMMGSAVADGDDGSYATTFGNECATVEGAGVPGDVYCLSRNTVTTKYMKYTQEDWQNAGVINESRGLSNEAKEFVTLAMNRESTVGVGDADVCQNYKDGDDRNFSDRVISWFTNLFEASIACSSDVPQEVALGTKYTLSNSNSNKGQVELYSGYMLYDEVYSLLSEKTSSASAYRAEYYKEHPKDNSAAGKIARRSGMTKAEAEIALNYAAYLNAVARYDASERYVFGEKLNIDASENTLVAHTNKISGELYCFSKEEIWYRDERNRSFTV